MAEAKSRSKEEIRAEVVAAAQEGRVPFAREEAARARTAPPAEVPEGVFTAADLTGALLERCQEYVVPGTSKRLYVFPLASADMRTLAAWFRQSLEGASADTPVQEHEFTIKVYQMILACRQGARRDSPPCFRRADADALAYNLGYGVVQEVCAIADALSGNDEQMAGGVRHFFGVIQACCGIWSSRLENCTDCPPGLKEQLSECAGLVSRATTRGKLDSGILDEVRAFALAVQQG